MVFICFYSLFLCFLSLPNGEPTKTMAPTCEGSGVPGSPQVRMSLDRTARLGAETRSHGEKHRENTRPGLVNSFETKLGKSHENSLPKKSFKCLIVA